MVQGQTRPAGKATDRAAATQRPGPQRCRQCRRRDVDGGKGNDWIFGSVDRDMLDGGRGRDHIFAFAGKDLLIGGGGGQDFLFAGDGNDELHGDESNYDVDQGATPAADFMYGDDILFGGGGEDHLEGGNGDDQLMVVENATISMATPTTTGYQENQVTIISTAVPTRWSPPHGRSPFRSCLRLVLPS